MLRGAPPKKFCSAQARKVVKTMRTFSEADTDTWRACATSFVDEACARRYLSTRCWMASRAVMAITKTIEWRIALGLDSSSGDSSSGDSSSSGSDQPSWVRGCHHWGWEEEGRPIRVSPVKDKDGRPIVVLSARRWPEEDDEWLHMLIYALEEAAYQLKEANKSSAERQDDPAKTYLDTWTWVVDMSGATLADAPSWQALRKMDDMLYAHYPGRLARAIFVNMPGLLRLPFALALGLLDAKSREKITVVDDDRVKLENFVNAADVSDLFESRKREKKEGEKQTVPCKETTVFSFGSLFKCIS